MKHGLAKLAAVAAAGGMVAGVGALPSLPPARAAAVHLITTVSVDLARPGGAINEQLVGVNHPVAGAGSAMRAIGVSWARVDAWFQETTAGQPDYNCRTGAWNPAGLDSRVGLARDEGAKPLVLVDYSPACLATGAVPGDNANDYPPDVGADQAKWDALVYKMAYHEISAEGVRAFEIWNEPDGTFWRGTLAGYLYLYRDTVTVLEKAAAAAHTKIEVGGPALVVADPSWLEPFLDFVASEHLPLDFISWHYYADYPLIGPISPIPDPPSGTPPFWYNPALRSQTFGEQVSMVEAEVAAHRRADPSLDPVLWVDEWNANAGYDPRQDGPFDAAFAAAVLDSMQTTGLGRSCFYFVADDASDPLGNWGLLTSDLTPKPVWWAFRFWHELAGRQLPVVLTPDQSASDPVGRIGAVASTGSGDQVKLLLYNFVPWDPTGGYGTTDPTPYDHTVRVALGGLRRGTSYRWSESLVDGAHRQAITVASGRVRDPGGEITLDLAGESVALLSLTPAPPA